LMDPVGLCVDPCCENCEYIYENNRAKPTGKTRSYTEWDEGEILRWLAYKGLMAAAGAAGGVSIDQSGGKTFVIGTKYVEEEWAFYDCVIEICLDTMMRSHESCNKNSGTEYWVVATSEKIEKIVKPDITLDDIPSPEDL
jgi:hypothetical protein